ATGRQQRMAAGLGLCGVHRWRYQAYALGLGAAAICVWLVLARSETVRLIGPASPVTGRGEPAWASRGAMVTRERPQLTAYRVTRDSRTEPLEDEIDRAEELTFGYANPSGRHRVLIFGVDEHRHVFWYFPSWQRRQVEAWSLHGLPVKTGSEIVALPEAISHQL